MICDVATAHFKNAIRYTNIFTPKQLVEKLVGVKGLVPIYLRGNDRELPFRTGWADVLGKYVKKPPPGFTANFHFEFREDGTMDLRPLAESPDSEVETHLLVENVAAVREAFMQEVFGTSDIDAVTMRGITLPTFKTKTLTAKKAKSISEKYFSIPSEHLWFYKLTEEELAMTVRQLRHHFGAISTCMLSPTPPHAVRVPWSPYCGC